MTKPDDIPQDVWDSAKGLAEAVQDHEIEGKTEIAYAVLAAKNDERIRCVGIALSFVKYGGDTHHGVTCNPMADAMEIARAIHGAEPTKLKASKGE